MTPGAIKIETLGSYFWIDEDRQQYMRSPKEEAPREKPEWGDASAGGLQDWFWHPYVSWYIHPCGDLRIMLDCSDPDPANHWGIRAPHAQLV